MSAVLDAVPAAPMPSGLPVALTIAIAVTALVAIGFLVVDLRRSGRLNRITGSLTALGGLGVLAGALMVGSAFSFANPALSEQGDTPAAIVDHADDELTDLELPTLPLP